MNAVRRSGACWRAPARDLCSAQAAPGRQFRPRHRPEL